MFSKLLYAYLDWTMRKIPPPNNMKTLAEIIPTVALSFVGRQESPKGSNKGIDLKEFFEADNFDPNGDAPGDDGYPWCAAFVDRVVQVAMEQGSKEYTFKRPTTASAYGFEAWSLKQDSSTKTIKIIKRETIKAGDIVMFEKFSHVAIAVSDADSNGFFETVEGNTNSQGGREGFEVAHKKGSSRRYWMNVRSLIRFTV